MYEMVFNGQPILVYDPYTALKEGLIFKSKTIILYKDEDTMLNLSLNTRIEYRMLVGYLENGWKIFK
jgi:hypothetical protein